MRTTPLPGADVGEIAVQVFACVLGAVLIIFIASDSPQSREPSLPVLQTAANGLQLADKSLHRAAQLTDVIDARLKLRDLDALARSLTNELAPLRKRVTANADLASNAAKRQLQLDETKRQALAAEAESKRAQARLAQLRSEADNRATNRYAGILGGYRGQTVVLDCDADGVTVLPGNVRLPVESLDRGVKDLRPQIEKAGFVAIVARPGSFDRVYDAAFFAAGQLIEEANRQRATPLGRGSFPLGAQTPIADVLPKGAL